jgi:hypothetical protein
LLRHEFASVPKRHEDEVATSSDDSFPASDPPSFTGVTSAADVEKKNKGQRTPS